MMRSTILAFLVLSCASFARCESPAMLDLSGADWRIHEDADGKAAERGMPSADVSSPGWIPAAVPGNIQADLEAAHLLKPLWYGAGDPRMAEVAQKNWCYVKDFLVPESFAGKRLTLIFNGVDQNCVVTLNGKQLGSHVGMFERFKFDVTESVKAGAINELVVWIPGISKELAGLVAAADDKDGANVNKPYVSILKTSKELKSAINNAYDWGVAIYTLGIWKDVRLEASGPARIDWVQIRTKLENSYSRAKILARLEIDSTIKLKADIIIKINGNESRAVKTIPALIEKGANDVASELVLDNPKLWWPNGHGDQSLYELEISVHEHASGRLMHSCKTRIGIREVYWEPTQGTPAKSQNHFRLVLNGRPIRMMGSNIVPPDLLFGRIRDNGLRLIRLAHEAGFNKLRVWGGGIILPEEMYEMADELGIMLFQEFPLSQYPLDDPEFVVNLKDTATNIVKQLRNHPSIIEWSGGNEVPWGRSDHPALQVLREVARQFDDRIFRDTSPIDGEGGHWPYIFHPAECPPEGWGYAGATNYYQGWNSKPGMRFGEFATNSPANLEVWYREIPPDSQWPLNDTEDPILVRKNIFHAVGGDSWLHKNHLEKYFGTFGCIEELIEAGQFFGAEGLRYAMDELRRRGEAVGGFTSWIYNEPWPNGAGSYMIDYDGRPLMNYDFVRQALAPVSLTLKYDSILYSPEQGVKAELFLTSDTLRAVDNLRWSWKARDRRGRVFADGKGTASIEPIKVKSLGAVELKPPAKTAFGPVFVELRLEDSAGKLLAERIHAFALDGVATPLAGLLNNRGEDSDDDAPQAATAAESPAGLANLAYVGNGARPATASSAYPDLRHQPAGLNDGKYGNDHSWIGASSQSWFQIDLGKPTKVARFKLGRDRTGAFSDRGVDSLKIETSLDGQSWKTVFEKSGITALPGFSPVKTMTIEVAPIEARYVKATVDPKNPDGGEMACIDEFEVYAPSKEPSAELPSIAFKDSRPELWRPVRRTSLEVKALPARVEGEREVLELIVKNAGAMTALFCEPHPLVEYRTDLYIDNNHCFIPPGESRTITIKADINASGGLTLAQTGWRISCWNADDVVIEPNGDVLLAVGRRDKMCREYLGYFDASKIKDVKQTSLEGRSPDTAQLPYLLDSDRVARFNFSVSAAQAKRPARLRIHAADQSKDVAAAAAMTINGQAFEKMLPKGIALQKDNPTHLAFPATATFEIPTDVLREGENVVEVRVSNGGWFTWDAIDFIDSTKAER